MFKLAGIDVATVNVFLLGAYSTEMRIRMISNGWTK